ncbi:hypothetical protein Glove_74g213 [Diversispora epigaea]|uniref:TLDc domain-containing protein n=1 Tax=Diversispora epigaea TaxID=1348612 RepID=A0A397JI82_9GLOM|nr:hypothetical protein Glove_74g213 [Diversispora epigaea]
MIFPYQQILEPKLWSDINSKLLAPNKPISSTILPPRKILNKTLKAPNSLSSNIITEENALRISSWIDKRESRLTKYTKNNPYEFKLLVRRSRDGFNVKTIYEICDKISSIVIVLKVKDTGEVLGGYNPCVLDKNKDEWIHSQDSFAFSLKTKNSILSRVKNFDHAIANFPKQSKLFFSNVLCLVGNLKTEKNCCSLQNEFSYEKPVRSEKFTDSILSDKSGFNVEEYEVFKIQKK